MSSLYENSLYFEDVKRTSSLELPWEKLQGTSVALSGITGLIGSFLVDVLMEKNESGLDCHIYGFGRSEEKARKRFDRWWGSDHFTFIEQDINEPIDTGDLNGSSDYVLHLASNTHPVQYASDPIGTIAANVYGLRKMLDLAASCSARRFLFASSCEIYGENRGDTELFDEQYCGYIDPNTLRAGYPESKRCGEALCQAYRHQKGLDIVIPRFVRSYGPTMQMTDTKAISQFIKRAVLREDIVLKSAGTQLYSYTYVADAVSGLLTVLLEGNGGEAYNIADPSSDIMLKDLAQMLAGCAGTEVVFDLPDELEAAGYSKATKALSDGTKIRNLGWKPSYTITEGIERTVKILRDLG